MIHDIRMLQETQHSQLLTHLCFNWRKIILPPGSQLDTGRLRLPLHLIAPLHGCLIRSPHMCLRWLVGMATQANGPPMDRTIVSSLHVQVFQPHGQWEYIYIYIQYSIFIKCLSHFTSPYHSFTPNEFWPAGKTVHLHRIHLSHVSWDCRLGFWRWQHGWKYWLCQ